MINHESTFVTTMLMTLALACGSEPGDETASDSAETVAPTGSTTDDPTATGPTTTASTATESTMSTSLDMTAGTETSTTEPSTTTETTSESTTDEPVSACVFDECLTRHSFNCEEFGTLDCDFDCEFAGWDCGLPQACPPIKIQNTSESMDVLVLNSPVEDAICVLQQLRDRNVGRVTIEWGDIQGFWADAAVSVLSNVDIVGDEGVLMTWDWDRPCCVETLARSQHVLIQPPAFFADCLADPTPEKLVACIVGAEPSPLEPAPDGYFPPWTLGMCDEKPPSCPS